MYKTIKQKEIESSHKFHVGTFRSPETEAKETAMDDFMFWLQHDCELEVSKEHMDDLQNLINLYVGYDIDKVKAGELEMLQAWKDAVNK